LRRGHDAELFTVDPDQTNRTDADLLVDPRSTVVLRLLRMTIEGGNTCISFPKPERQSVRRRLLDGSLDPLGPARLNLSYVSGTAVSLYVAGAPNLPDKTR